MSQQGVCSPHRGNFQDYDFLEPQGLLSKFPSMPPGDGSYRGQRSSSALLTLTLLVDPQLNIFGNFIPCESPK